MALPPSKVVEPFTNNVYAGRVWWSISGVGGVSSEMKSTNTWAFIVVNRTYQMSNLFSSIDHLNN